MRHDKAFAALALTALLIPLTPLNVPLITASISVDAPVTTTPPWIKGVLIKGPVLDVDYDPSINALIVGTAEGAYLISTDNPANMTTLLKSEEVSKVAVDGRAGTYVLITAYGIESYTLNGSLRWFRKLGYLRPHGLDLSSKGFTALTFVTFQSGSIVSRIVVYDPNGELLVNLSVNTLITGIKWSPSGNYLITKDYDNSITLYSFRKGSLKPLQRFDGVRVSSWGRSGDVLALSDTYGAIKLIDVPSGKVREYYVGLTPQTISWGLNDTEILLGGRERVAVLSLNDSEVRYSRHLLMEPVSVTWLRKGGAAVILENSGHGLSHGVDYALLTLSPNLAPVSSIVTINGTPLGVYPSSDGALVVTTSGIWVFKNSERTLSIYEPVTGDYANPHDPSIADEYHVALLISKSHDNGALYDNLLYITYSGGVIWEKPIAWDISDVDASRDASLVAVVGDYLYVFNASDGSLLWSAEGGFKVKWDPRSELLAVTRFNELTLYDREGKLVGSAEIPYMYEDLLWSPDGAYVAVIGYDEVLVFGRNLSKITEIHVGDTLTWVEWDPSGGYLWMSFRGSVGKFRLDGVQVANVTLGRFASAQRFSVSPDGNLIAVSTEGKVYVFSARGGPPLWIKQYDGYFAQPIWSSDGGKLLIVVPYSSGRGEVILCRSNGGEIYHDFVDGGFVNGRVVDELKLILLAGWDGVMYINYTDGSLPWSADKELVGALHVSYAPQGNAVLVDRHAIKRMGSSGYAPQVRIYDLNGEVMHEFNYRPGNTAGVGLQLSRDGNLVLVTGIRMNYSVLKHQVLLRMYDVNGTKLWARTFNMSSSDALPLWLIGSDKIAVPISYEGTITAESLTMYYITTLYTVVILNQYTGVEIARTKPSKYPIRDLIPGDGGYFAVIHGALEGNVIEVYDGNASIKGVIPVEGYVRTLSLSRYANTLAYGLTLGYDEYRLVSRRLNGDIIKSVDVNTSILKVSVSREGLIAVMYGNGTLAIYTSALKLVAKEDLITGSTYGEVLIMSWSPSGNHLATYVEYFRHGEIRVYDKGLKPLFWNYVDKTPQTMAWVNSSALFIAGEHGGEFVCIDKAPPSPSLVSPNVGGHVVRDYALTSKYLYLLLDRGTVAIISVGSGELLMQEVLDPLGLHRIAAYEDLLATYGSHGTINVYRVKGNSLKPILTAPISGFVRGIDVNYDAIAVAGYDWVKVLNLDGSVKWSKELGGGAYVLRGPELNPESGYLVCSVKRKGVLEVVVYSSIGEEVLRYPLRNYRYFYGWISDKTLLLYDGGSTISLIDVQSKQRKDVPLNGLPTGVVVDRSLKVAYVSLSKGALLRITADGEVTEEEVPASKVVGVGSDGSAYLISSVNFGQLLKYSPSQGLLTEYQVLGVRVLRMVIAESVNGNLLVVARNVKLVKPAKYGLLFLLPSDVAVNVRVGNEEYHGVKGGLRLYAVEGVHEALFMPAEKLEGIGNLVGSTEWLTNLTVIKEYSIKAGHVLVGKLPSTNDFLKSAGTIVLDASGVKALKYSCIIKWVDGEASKDVSPGQELRIPALPGEYVITCTASLPEDIASRALTPPPPEGASLKVRSGVEATLRLRGVNELYGTLTIRNNASTTVKYSVERQGTTLVTGGLEPGDEATYYAPPGKHLVRVEYVEVPSLDVGNAEVLSKGSAMTKELSIEAGKQYTVTPATQLNPARILVKGTPGLEFTVAWEGGKKTFRIPEGGIVKLRAAPYTEYVIEARVSDAQSITRHVKPLPPGGEAVVELLQPRTTTSTTTTQATTSTSITAPKAKQPNYAPIIAGVVIAAIVVIAALTYRRRRASQP